MRIQKLSSSVPEYEYTTEEMIRNFPCDLPDGVRDNVLNLGVSRRALINPSFKDQESENLLSEKELVSLCVNACLDAMKASAISPSKVGYFIAAYDVSPILAPGLSQILIRNIGFDPYVKHVNATGTASIAFPKALQLAEDHLTGHPKDNVLICVSGVSSYWFQNQVHGMRDILETKQISQIRNQMKRRLEVRKWIAAMEYFLFGDAAVAAIVSNEDDGLAVKDIAEVTNIEKDNYLAGYSRLSALPETFRFGFHSHLSKEIPSLGVKYTCLALRKLLGKKTQEMIRASKKWAVHTGSQKILDALAEHHRIAPEKLEESRDVLRDYGNLSAASLPFILERILSSSRLSQGDNVLMVGYGWGFSSAASLLEV